VGAVGAAVATQQDTTALGSDTGLISTKTPVNGIPDFFAGITLKQAAQTPR
jgi:hypothetical protein